MNENYRGYMISAIAWQNPGDVWRPKVVIIDSTGSTVDLAQYTHKQQYPSEAQAESAGMQWAKRLIDDWVGKKP